MRETSASLFCWKYVRLYYKSTLPQSPKHRKHKNREHSNKTRAATSEECQIRRRGAMSASSTSHNAFVMMELCRNTAFGLIRANSVPRSYTCGPENWFLLWRHPYEMTILKCKDASCGKRLG